MLWKIKYYKKNLEIISSYDKELADKILMLGEKKSTSKNKFALAMTQAGEYNILFNDIPIHNSISAIEEAKNIIKNLPDKENTLRIVYGLGLGYLADELSLKTKKGKILIYEPEIDLINFVLNLANIDALAQKNVFLCNDKETFQKHVFNLTDENTQMSVSFIDFYKNNYMSEIKEILQLAQIEQGKKKGNINTIIKKSFFACCNIFHNIKQFSSCGVIEDYKDIYKGKNALILSAGPSAGENIDLIKKYKYKYIIFAVNSVVKLLNENDIVPDFIVDIEACNFGEQQKNNDFSKSYLILEAFSEFRKFDIKSKGKILYISKNNFLNNWVKRFVNSRGDLKTLGTVTYSAINCAYVMGFKNIVLLGSDLAYKNGKCYSKGSHFENLECIFDEKEQKYKIETKNLEEYAKNIFGECNEFYLKEVQKKLDLLNNTLYTVKGSSGKMLPTQTDYAVFVNYFEDLAREIKSKDKEINLYNCSQGALIKGFEDVLFEEISSKFENTNKIELTIKNQFQKEKAKEEILKAHSLFYGFFVLTEELISEALKIINDLKIKKTVTENIAKKIKKYNQKLKTSLSFKVDKEFAILFVKYNLEMSNLINNSNPQTAKEILALFEKMRAVCEETRNEFGTYIYILANG